MNADASTSNVTTESRTVKIKVPNETRNKKQKVFFCDNKKLFFLCHFPSLFLALEIGWILSQRFEIEPL